MSNSGRIATSLSLRVSLFFALTVALVAAGPRRGEASITDCNSNGIDDFLDVAEIFPSAPDNGEGSVHIPPVGVPYYSTDPLVIIDGLPPGTTIEINATLTAIFNFPHVDKGSPPVSRDFEGDLFMSMTGTGSLAGFSRLLNVPLSTDVNANVVESFQFDQGDPVQSFDSDLFRLQGELFGDPDFDGLGVFAGEDYGHTSPGHTTLKLLPSNEFSVDSFFDIEYEIQFEGAPGSVLDGLAGGTVGTTRLRTRVPPFSEDCNDNDVPDECEPDADVDGVPDDCDNCGLFNPDQADCNENGVGDVCDLDEATSLDCQPDGIPDECQLVVDYVSDSGQIYTLDNTNPGGVTHTFTNVPMAQGNVTLHFESESDLGDDSEYVMLSINGESRGTVLDFSWEDCVLKSEDLIIPAAEWNTLRADNGGDIDLLMVPSEEVDDFCDSYIRVVVEITHENDCNENGIPDDCDIASGFSEDCDVNGVPDECQNDCDNNGTIDACEGKPDCNRNGVPDDCDIAQGDSLDENGDDVPDECGPDCNENGIDDEDDTTGIFPSAPDNGNDTVDIPAVGIDYFSTDPLVITNGLPPGTTIEMDAVLVVTANLPHVDKGPPPTSRNFEGELQLAVTGTGDLAGFNRMLTVPLGTYTNANVVDSFNENQGAPVQSFDSNLHSMDGFLFGDPDFDSLNIVAGEGFGLFSPGQTTLTRLPSSDFSVDSFFDIEYDILFVGAPGSVLDGLSGNTFGSTRLRTRVPASSEDCNNNEIPDECEVDSDEDGVINACDNCDLFNPDQEDCNNNGIGDVCDIDSGTSLDCNENGVPDECDVLPDSPLVPDNGEGTADFPPIGIPYVAEKTIQITEGLEPGDSIDIDAVLTISSSSEFDFKGNPVPPGAISFGGDLQLTMTGTGGLTGFSRIMTLPVEPDSSDNLMLADPQSPGDPVQDFDTQILSLGTWLEGTDPDFSELHFDANQSAGHTTLRQMPSGEFAMDSFFDISYQIYFNGESGGALDGLQAGAIGRVRFSTFTPAFSEDCNENMVPDECEDDIDQDGTIDDCDNCSLFNPDQADCNDNGIGDLCDIDDGTSQDCNANDVPDECDVVTLIPSAPDNGNGTVDIPPDGVPYMSVDPFEITDGLPPGDAILIDMVLIASSSEPFDDFKGGPPPPGDSRTFRGNLQVALTGTGGLSGYSRMLSIPLIADPFANLVGTGPRIPGDPIQEFESTLFNFNAQLFGDPDFDMLFIGGGGSQLSDGFTILTELPSGDFTVDSFFDVRGGVYFEGASGGIFDGLSGDTSNRTRFQTTTPAFSEDCNENDIPDECDLDTDDDGTPDDCDNCDLFNPDQADCNNNGIGDICDIDDATSLDCQPDGIPDECQLVLDYHSDSGELYTFDNTNRGGVDHTLTNVPFAIEDVTLRFESESDLGSTSEYCFLSINGAFHSLVLDFSWDDCLLKTDELTFPAQEWNAFRAINGGNIDLNMTPSSDVDDFCDSYIRVIVETSRDNDCNSNGIPDDCDIADGTSEDCDGNGIPDECENDCDNDGTIDACEGQQDCNENGIPDDCDIEFGASQDCNENGIPDECEPDCNNNGIVDECDITDGTSADCDGNEVPDECDPDCNLNGLPDGCDIMYGISTDCQPDGIPDECQLNAAYSSDSGLLTPFDDTLPEGHDVIFTGVPAVNDDVVIRVTALADLESPFAFADVFLNGTFSGSLFDDAFNAGDCSEIVEDLTISASAWNTARTEGHGDILVTIAPSEDVGTECDASWVRLSLEYSQVNDCNNNGIPDECDIASGASIDCDGNGIPDECEADCNNNGIVDACDILNGPSNDCDGNGVPDECEPDCNENGIVDTCDIFGEGQCPTLPGAEASLQTLAPSITSLIPNPFDFAMDGDDEHVDNNIDDGGNDMYDDGNFLNTNLASQFFYTDGLVTPSDAIFGPGSSYFTKKYDSFFVLVATDISISSFSITGENGADGDGIVDAAVLPIPGAPYTAFVKRIGLAGDPTINQIILVPGGSSGITHDFAFDTDDSYQEISGAGVESLDCLVYILAATDDDQILSDESVNALSRGVLQGLLSPSAFSEDLNFDGVPDECAIFDCNGNGRDDSFDFADGTSMDCNNNGIPDECDIENALFIVPDNGSGSVDIPPVGLPYLSQTPLEIIDGLPPGTAIEIDAVLTTTSSHASNIGTSLGGEIRDFLGTLHFDMTGTGSLAGFSRSIDLPVTLGRADTAPRNPADNVQDFDTDMTLLLVDLVGDPDFDTLSLDGGTALGLPSPGHTTLSRLPSGDFTVDSFFDIEYELSFVGAPGSALDGLSGTTTATVRFEMPGTLSVSTDCDRNGVPDECEPDCNDNGIVDACDILFETSEDCDGNGVPDECDPDCNGNGIPDACDLIGDALCPSLPEAVIGLEVKASSISSLIPNRFDFVMDGTNGHTGYEISDGGNDMYDDGNHLNTNLIPEIEYTDGVVTSSDSLFGTGSSYFTKKHDSFFVLAASDISISSFSITGENGADGSGFVQDAVLGIMLQGNGYTAFVKEIGGAGDPTINQIIVVPGDGADITHDFSTDTDDSYQEISGTGVGNLDCLVYILAATGDNEVLADNEAKALAVAVLGSLSYGTGLSRDCNLNGVPDECDILDQTLPAAPDNGHGTVDIPPVGIPYRSVSPIRVTHGLPPGSALEVDLEMTASSNFSTDDKGEPQGGLRGFDGTLRLTIHGTGEYDGYLRVLDMSLDDTPGSNAAVSAPHASGDPVQEFDTELLALLASAPSDPHFEFAVLEGGTFPVAESPGHTTLTLLPSGEFSVDSFFDVSYSLELDGTVGGPFDGLIITDSGTVRIETAHPTVSQDCNENGIPDDCDIAEGTSPDCNLNGIPDECEPDCNGNNIPDECDIRDGTSEDCDLNGVPDECQNDCDNDGVPDACEPDCNHNGIPDDCDLRSDALCPVLPDGVFGLDEAAASISLLIPNRFDFAMDGPGGHTGTSIDDGGGDMYDPGGNTLRTNLHSGTPGFQYTDGVVTSSDSIFGAGSSYFTKKHDGFFVLAATDISISSFSVRGDIGADDQGPSHETVLSFMQNGNEYTAFLRLIGGAGDPTINQIIVVPGDGTDITHTFAPDTHLGDQEISGTGVESLNCLVYILASTSDDQILTDNDAVALSQAVIEALSYGSGFSRDEDGNGVPDECDACIDESEPPMFTDCAPETITVSAEPGLCSAVVTFDTPAATDSCPPAPVVSQTAGLSSGSAFPVGTTIVTFTATDRPGHTAECSFDVIVTDDEDPQITCPADIVADKDPGICGAVVTYALPAGTDNCPGATTVLITGLGSGSAFPVGSTTETYEVTDAAGNTAQCSFTVTVNDTSMATIGGTVFSDINRNGLQDDGAGGEDGVTVNLLDDTESVVDTTITAGGGLYQFSVSPGTYTVEVENPANRFIAPQNQGAVETDDSDVDPDTGRSDPIVIEECTEPDIDVDAGLFDRVPGSMLMFY